MHAVTLTTGEIADLLLLVAALEVEATHVGARRDFVVADTDLVGTVGNLLEHRLAAVEVVAALVNASQLHGFADFDGARVRLLLAHQHAEQCGFTRTVTADHANDGAFWHRERQVVDQHAVAVALADVLELDDLVTQARTGRDVDFVGLGTLLELLGLHLFETRQTGLGFRLTRLGAFTHPFQLVFHGLFMGRLLLGFGGQTVGLGFQPTGVVALVRDTGATVELEDPASNVVQEVPVVRDRNHGAREVVQEMLQPGDGIGVQVVGRFVEQQHVGGRQQQAAQGHTTLFTTGQVFNLGVPRRQAQRVGGDFQLAVQVVTVGGLQDGFELGLFCRQFVEVGVFFSVGRVDLVQAGLGVLDHADRFLDHFTHGLGRVQDRFLWQVADVQVGHRAGFAVELGVDAGHDFQQGGFTRTVEAEHADLGAWEEGQRNVFQDFPLRRNNFSQPMHGEDVLSHGEPSVSD
eukprot:gene11818-biopygen4574